VFVILLPATCVQILETVNRIVDGICKILLQRSQFVLPALLLRR